MVYTYNGIYVYKYIYLYSSCICVYIIGSYGSKCCVFHQRCDMGILGCADPNNKWVQPSYTTNSAWNITDHQQFNITWHSREARKLVAMNTKLAGKMVQQRLRDLASTVCSVCSVCSVFGVHWFQSSPKKFLVSGGQRNILVLSGRWNHHRHGITMES
jgi:hypothetical protein